MSDCLHIDFSFLFISPLLFHLVLLPRSLFDLIEFVVIVKILGWREGYDMVVAIARLAVDWFVVADAEDGDNGNEDGENKDEEAEILP
jgi:hypothetical protein